MREHENINARYIQYMYTFVYKWCSLFSHSTVYVRSLKDATLKKNRYWRQIHVREKTLQVEVSLSF